MKTKQFLKKKKIELGLLFVAIIASYIAFFFISSREVTNNTKLLVTGLILVTGAISAKSFTKTFMGGIVGIGFIIGTYAAELITLRVIISWTSLPNPWAWIVSMVLGVVALFMTASRCFDKS